MEIRSTVLVASILIGSLSLLACAEQPRGRPITAEGWKRIEEEVKLTRLEREKFDASHPLKGQVADPALRQLHDEGYACHIGYLDLPRIAKGTSATFEFVRTPLVFCMQRSTQPDDFCMERHVNLSIGWQDPKAPESELRAQLISSVITDRAFRCDTASDVKHR
ncbi:hypothetical protein [Ralstonia pseudosolanacearum]|uniref:Lipoprotein n=1 Tax=Ralstonia solanacearum TaxID=305 RepID=A0AA92ECH4_RALSL|nr:hypothetical protein [Ralstonia pseudosolanacearum]QCX49357.1 hypothetical protein E7Z57_09715 [Ralstonia pseudosolanacearum]